MFWRFPVVLSSFPFCPVFSHKHISALGQCRKQKSFSTFGGRLSLHKRSVPSGSEDPSLSTNISSHWKPLTKSHKPGNHQKKWQNLPSSVKFWYFLARLECLSLLRIINCSSSSDTTTTQTSSSVSETKLLLVLSDLLPHRALDSTDPGSDPVFWRRCVRRAVKRRRRLSLLLNSCETSVLQENLKWVTLTSTRVEFESPDVTFLTFLQSSESSRCPGAAEEQSAVLSSVCCLRVWNVTVNIFTGRFSQFQGFNWARNGDVGTFFQPCLWKQNRTFFSETSRHFQAVSAAIKPDVQTSYWNNFSLFLLKVRTPSSRVCGN